MLLSVAEGFPRVINEALLHSLPIIVTPVGSVPDELADGEHAVFVATKSPETVARAIDEIINHQALRQHLIREGYTWGVEQMSEPSWQQHARVLGLIEE